MKDKVSEDIFEREVTTFGKKCKEYKVTNNVMMVLKISLKAINIYIDFAKH